MAPAEEDPTLFILPLRNFVMYPSVKKTIELSERSVEEIKAYLQQKGGAQGIGAVTMRPREQAGATAGWLYEVGTLCDVSFPTTPKTEAAEKGGSAKYSITLQGKSRFKVLSYVQTSPFRLATVQAPLAEMTESEDDVAVRALVHNVHEHLNELLVSPQDAKASSKRQVRWPTAPSILSAVVGSTLTQLSVDERQRILEIDDVKHRLECVLDILMRELEAKRMGGEIIGKMQKLREQELRQILVQRQIQEVKKELQKLPAKAPEEQDGEGEGDLLGEGEGENEEQEEWKRLAERIPKAGLTQDALKIAKRELKRLKSIQPQHPEYTQTHTYLELLTSLPWNKSSEDCFDIARARRVLDEDHRGLEKVKVRILEFLAVQKLRRNMKGPILCLHGPPGIGKTSLGRSVARALGRKFHRLALGGVRDESELRGHRRTYIGSMAGSIIQAFQTVGVNNPVILLDEVDKLTQNTMFNPQAALLEILDPEQNGSFKDHYMNTPFSLENVLFICTANDTSLIDRPLLDRMEVIELSGYTVEEKLAITSTHLLPKQRQLHALESPKKQLSEPAAPAAEPEDSAVAKGMPAPAAAEDASIQTLATAVEDRVEAPRLTLSPEAVS
jgi:ATP-dependent Lon protease